MKKVKLHDKQFKLFINYEIIISKIENLVSVLNKNYADKKPIFLCVLNGSFLFASELIKRFNHECEVSFVKLSSYQGLNSTGNIKNLIGINDNLEERNIIIVEDIVDSGLTVESISQDILKSNPGLKPNRFLFRAYSLLSSNFIPGFGSKLRTVSSMSRKSASEHLHLRCKTSSFPSASNSR